MPYVPFTFSGVWLLLYEGGICGRVAAILATTDKPDYKSQPHWEWWNKEKELEPQIILPSHPS